MSKEETTQAVSLKSQCHVFASLQSARLDKDTCVQKQLDEVQQNGKDCSIFKVCFTSFFKAHFSQHLKIA